MVLEDSGVLASRKGKTCLKHRRGLKKVPEERNREKIESIKAEMKRLRKQVAYLQKENQKLRNRDESIKEFVEEYEHLEVQRQVEESIPRCPKCKSHHIKILPKLRGDIDYYVCDACPARGPIQNGN